MRSFCFFQIRISRQTFSERHTTHTDTLVGCTLRVSLAFLLVFIVVVTDSWPTVIFFDFFLKKKKTRVDYQKTTRSVTCELELQFSFFFCVERWGFLFFFCCLGCHFLRFSVRFFCVFFFEIANLETLGTVDPRRTMQPSKGTNPVNRFRLCEGNFDFQRHAPPPAPPTHPPTPRSLCNRTDVSDWLPACGRGKQCVFIPPLDEFRCVISSSHYISFIF